MTARNFEFAIHAHNLDGEQTVLVGRLYRGPLREGDSFTGILRYLVIEEPDGFAPSQRGEPRPVSVSVVAIESYGRRWVELDEGMTAEVTVASATPLSLSEGDVLVGSAPA